MNIYETIFIANANVCTEDVETLTQKVVSILQENKGEVLNIERWGVRRLAYIVKKFNRGNYVFLRIKADPKALQELARFYRLTDTIIKSIVLKEKIHRLKGRKAEKGECTPVKIEVGSDILSHPEDELA
ncbi:30S ribosomal protein S6 [Candidatus Desantisbacteria bacterium]|nr:30S ribosomal protein S6 [Candidatus Desantisbacteria bacterium]